MIGFKEYLNEKSEVSYFDGDNNVRWKTQRFIADYISGYQYNKKGRISKAKKDMKKLISDNKLSTSEFYEYTDILLKRTTLLKPFDNWESIQKKGVRFRGMK